MTSVGYYACISICRTPPGSASKTSFIPGYRPAGQQREEPLSPPPRGVHLQEFYALVNFVVPGYLGELRAFKNIFETAVLKGRDAGASEEEKEQGQMRMEELQKRCRGFILRRTADLSAAARMEMAD